MPGTKRTPVTRTPISPITPRMVELFDAMRRATGERRDRLHCDLFDTYMDALMPHPRPYEWPVCVDPRTDTNPYPPGTPAHASWQPDLRARRMWEMLADASRERRQQERMARRAKANGAPDQPPG